MSCLYSAVICFLIKRLLTTFIVCALSDFVTRQGVHVAVAGVPKVSIS